MYSHVIQKSCQVTRLRLNCDFQNPILIFPTHSIFTLYRFRSNQFLRWAAHPPGQGIANCELQKQ